MVPIETPSTDPLATTAGWGRWRIPFGGLVGSALIVGVVLRFVTKSPLWLDEALSVNIAKLPVGEIVEALRHDGHPPLFYVLLHGWMGVFGQSDWAVRAFSGLWSLALLPLVWVAARRIGGTRVAVYALALLALSPFAIRYGTETRMYAMVAVLSVAGWLLVDDALRGRATLVRLVAIACVVGALLWTHYWAIWFLLTAGIALLVHLWRVQRSGPPQLARSTYRVIAAVAVGGLTFLPWAPVMLYQGSHTGTPWARPMRPTEMVATMLLDFGGGKYAEATVLGWLFAAIAAVGLLGRAIDRRRIELDLRTRPEGRAFAILVGGTLAVACVTGYALNATFASRYASIIHPFVIILGALGLDQIRSRPIALAALTMLLVLGGIGGARNVVTDRSDARRSADVITANAERGDWVVYCPDQLGPATSRLLDVDVHQVTYPEFLRPQRVDWVDYKERLAETKPANFAAELLDRVGAHRIFLVYSTAYETHASICPALFNAIGRSRPPQPLTESTDAFEPAAVVLFAKP
ncbi:MAG: glycosyltransferase family 39 protein [Aquihabitans sp.]